MQENITARLRHLYSQKDAKELAQKIDGLVQEFLVHHSPAPSHSITKADAALITYSDSIVDAAGQAPLQTLREFLQRYDLSDTFSITHLLPFFPSDTDRGFSVTDYRNTDPALGTWRDIEALSDVQTLMFDFVTNHASIDNPIIQHALIANHIPQDHPQYATASQYKNFAITFTDANRPSEEELASLARPRPMPVLTRYCVIEESGKARAILGEAPDKNVIGTGWVWTTFSRPPLPDGSEATRQVDLNFKEPNVLLEVLRIILFYVSKKALYIRLDAIGYIWKKLGSSSLHEQEAHIIISVIRSVLHAACPGITLIAEVNEPQDTILSYLGTPQEKESDLVYQFTHFSLAIHAIHRADGEYYKRWLESTNEFAGRQFVTVLGSHDGMGIKATYGFLPEEESSWLIEKLAQEHGALPNHASLPGNKRIVYEMCATPWNLVNAPNSNEPTDIQLRKYMILLGLGLLVRGLPALYINGLLGSFNYASSDQVFEPRIVNREQFNKETLFSELDSKQSHMGSVLQSIQHVLAVRRSHSAFDPDGLPIHVLNTVDTIIGVHLPTSDGENDIFAFVNVSPKAQTVPESLIPNTQYTDILTGEVMPFSAPITLVAYQTRWLKRS